MKNTMYSKDLLNRLLPKEMECDYQADNLITTNQHNIIVAVFSKKTKERYVVKILDKKYYNKNLYQKIFHIQNSSLLLPIQTFSDASCFYSFYPHFETLAGTLSTKSISYSTLRSLISSIGNALISLHEHKILHLDITPNNIFFGKNGQFYLGDFSSALPVNTFQMPFFHRYFRTGTTSLFAPPADMRLSSISYWNDCYNIALLIYVLFNHGKFPDEKILLPSSSFEMLNSFLLKWLKKPSTIHSHMMQEFLTELEKILSLCDENNECQNYTLQLSNSNNTCFWENTPNCNIENSPSRQTNFLHQPFLQKNRFPVPLYGLLLFCGFLFLFSLYHYLAQSSHGKAQTDAILSEQISNLSETTTHISETQPPSAKTPFPSKSPVSTDTPLPDSDNSATEKKNILDVSGKKYQNHLSFKNLSGNTKLQILFANNCSFTSCSAFSSLSSLKELYLNANQITSLDGLLKLQKLEVLVLSKNKLTNISNLAKIPSLTMLDLSHNSQLSEIKSLASLKKLHYLILTNTNVSKKEILFLQKKLPNCTIFY